VVSIRRMVIVSMDAVSDSVKDEIGQLLEGARHRILSMSFSDPGSLSVISDPEEDWSGMEGIDYSDPAEPSMEGPIAPDGRPADVRHSVPPVSPVLLRSGELSCAEAVLENIFRGDLVITLMDSSSRDMVIPACYFSSCVMRKGAFSMSMVIRRGSFKRMSDLEEVNRLFLDLGLHHHGVIGLSPAVHRERRFLELAILVRHLGDMVFLPGVVNLDLADLMITSKGGTALVMSWGTSHTGGRGARTSIVEAIGNPLCDIDLSTVRKAMVHVVSHRDLTLEDSLVGTEFLQKRIRENARIIWGVTLVEDPDAELEVLIILATTPMELLLHWYSGSR